ncbi:MAG: aspartyl-phosphate phosphatase Spo0E family protein [Bacillota bacterium]
MSKNQLKTRIEEVNKELVFLMRSYNYDLLTPEVLQCSQRLDTLIAQFIKL